MPVVGENSLLYATGIDNSGLAIGTNEAVGLLRQFSSAVSKINPFVGLAASAITAFTTVATYAAQMVAEYERSMDRVRVISDQSEVEFDNLRKRIFSISAGGTVPAAELAKAYYEIVSAGYEGAQAVSLLEQSAINAEGGLIKVTNAAAGLIDILKAYNEETNSSAEVSDKLFKASELANTTFEELSSNIAKIAPAASLANVSFDSILASTVQLSQVGTPVAKAMKEIENVVEGVSRELGASWGEAFTLNEALSALYEKAGGGQDKFEKLIGSVEGAKTAMVLLKSEAQDVEEIMTDIGDSTGSAMERANKVAKTATGQWAQLKNSMQQTLEVLGSQVLGLLDSLALSINRGTRSFDDQSKALEREKLGLEALTRELNDVNITEKRRAEIISQIQREYGAFLGDIDLEAESWENVNRALKKVNETYVERIALTKLQEENEEAATLAAEASLDAQRERTKLNTILATEVKKLGLSLPDSGDAVADAKAVTKEIEAFQKTQGVDLAKGEVDAYERLRRDIDATIESLQKAEQQADSTNKRFQELRERNRAPIEAYLKIIAPDEEISKIPEEIKQRIRDIRLSDNRAELKKLLDDENNLIREAAKERIEILGSQDPGSGLSAFEENLKKATDKYKEMFEVMENISDEEFDNQFSSLIKGGKNLADYYRNQLAAAKDYAEKRAVILAASAEGIELGNLDQQVEGITEGIVGLKVDFTVPPDSIESLEDQLDIINRLLIKSTDESEQAILRKRRDSIEEQIQLIREGKGVEANILKDLNLELGDLDFSELRKMLEKLRTLRTEYIKAAGGIEKANKAILDEIDENIDAVVNNMAREISEAASQIAQAFGELSTLFAKFGNEDVSRLVGQLGDLSNAIGSLAAGIQSENPFQIAAGIAGIANSVITVEISSQTAEFEKVIEGIERAVDRLDYAISQSIGSERIENRKEAIEKQIELEEAYEAAVKAEEAARKQVKFLGITIGQKGEGSGTDPEKVKEFEEAAIAARREVEQLEKQLKELYTGTSLTSITDAIIDGFREGKDSVKDFADTFEELMRNAMFEALKIKYLEKDVEKFFDEFAAFSGDAEGLNAAEIAELKALFNRIIEDNAQKLEDLNRVLGEAGIAGDAINQQGLRGEIQTITEDTAGVLAGTLNSIRLDVREGLEQSNQATLYLAQIRNNTGLMVDLIELSNTRLTNIEKALS